MATCNGFLTLPRPLTEAECLPVETTVETAGHLTGRVEPHGDGWAWRVLNDTREIAGDLQCATRTEALAHMRQSLRNCDALAHDLAPPPPPWQTLGRYGSRLRLQIGESPDGEPLLVVQEGGTYHATVMPPRGYWVTPAWLGEVSRLPGLCPEWRAAVSEWLGHRGWATAETLCAPAEEPSTAAALRADRLHHLEGEGRR
jgi:hypothetical protein